MTNNGIWTRITLFAATDEHYWNNLEARRSSQDHAELLAFAEKFFADAKTLGKIRPVEVELEQINWDCRENADQSWTDINRFETKVKDFSEFKAWLGI